MGIVAKVLNGAAKVFTGSSVVSYSPHSLVDEPECPEELR